MEGLFSRLSPIFANWSLTWIAVLSSVRHQEHVPLIDPEIKPNDETVWMISTGTDEPQNTEAMIHYSRTLASEA